MLSAMVPHPTPPTRTHAHFRTPALACTGLLRCRQQLWRHLRQGHQPDHPGICDRHWSRYARGGDADAIWADWRPEHDSGYVVQGASLAGPGPLGITPCFCLHACPHAALGAAALRLLPTAAAGPNRYGWLLPHLPLSAGVTLASQLEQSVGMALSCYAALASLHMYSGYQAVRQQGQGICCLARS